MENDNDNDDRRGTFPVEKTVDLMDFDNGQPNWLSPQGRRPELFQRIRAKYRARHKAEREAPVERHDDPRQYTLDLDCKPKSLIDYWVSLGAKNVTGTGRGFTIGTGGPVEKPKVTD